MWGMVVAKTASPNKTVTIVLGFVIYHNPIEIFKY